MLENAWQSLKRPGERRQTCKSLEVIADHMTSKSGTRARPPPSRGNLGVVVCVKSECCIRNGWRYAYRSHEQGANDMGVTDGICSAALSTLHGLLWLRGCLYWLVTCLWSTALYSLKHKGCELSSIQRDARSLSKLPLSLAVVVQEEALSYSDLAKAVTWACASGVSTITLYDPYGTGNQTLHPHTKQALCVHATHPSPPPPQAHWRGTWRECVLPWWSRPADCSSLHHGTSRCSPPPPRGYQATATLVC